MATEPNGSHRAGPRMFPADMASRARIACHTRAVAAASACRRAMAAGAVTLEAPLGTPHGDRCAMVRDPFGNIYRIAARTTG